MRMYKHVTNIYPKHFYKNINNYPHCDKDICLCISNLNMKKLSNLNYYKKCYNMNNFYKNKKFDINLIINYYNNINN
jgi:hypothetical protein